MLIVFLAIIAVVQWLVASWTTPGLETWYADLERPSWTPPSIAFPIVWPVLYLLMAVAAWQAWRSAPGRVGWQMTAFFVQLALNLVWTYFFFTMGDVTLAFIDILALLLAILATITAFAQVSRAAAWLMVPYVLWVTYAATLNAAIVEMNV
jgi:tryptophan-rich sensory protein